MNDPATTAAELQRTLEQAFSSYGAGRLADAAAQCRQVLEAIPSEPNALHLLGIVHLMNGEAATAADTLTLAAECQPDNAEIHNSLGAALRASGRLDDAEASFRRAIKLNPGASQGYFNLGNTLAQARRHGDAENCYRTALSIDPHHLGAIVALGGLAEATGETDAAIAWYRNAITLDATIAEAHRRLGVLLGAAKDKSEALAHLEAAIAIEPDVAATHGEIGAVLAATDRIGEAVASFARAVELDPGSAEALGNYATALCQSGEADASLAHFDKALRIDPGNAEIHANLANVLTEIGRTDEALTHYDEALALDPRHADALSSKANTLKALGRPTDALETYETALEIAPDHADARYGASVVRLSLGHFEDGWADYRWRPSMRGADPSIHREPLDQDLTGRDILVIKDQGLGDELFFLRFVADLSARGARLTYRADHRIAQMIRRTGLFERVVEVDPPNADFDRAVSIGDLPWLLSGETARATPPSCEIPALGARIRDMTALLRTAGPPPYVGLTWRAGTTGIRGALSKEAPIAEVTRALGDIEGTVVVVQREPTGDELSSLADGLRRPPSDLSAFNVELEDMLALMELLDEYVAVSNTNVHLRAARGRTSRILVPLPGEWRWMASGTSTPWFEGSTVYRETTDDGWASAFKALERDLDHG
jgi:tetratricopeptide (TPR) repeat protein